MALSAEQKSRVLEVLDTIATDMEADTVAMEGKPFTGEVVAGAFGELRATVQALANIVKAIVE